MVKPDVQQMLQARDALIDMAGNLRKLKQQKVEQLSIDDIAKINQAIVDTLNKASAVHAKTIGSRAGNIQNCISRIDDAKKALSSAVDTAGRVKNVMKIAEPVVQLASAVALGDVQSIMRSAGDVIDATKSN
ncbi:MAG TPA: hypothetical protein VL197_01610 [Nitrospirota bacterium]|nr:hypothetical protein [Nitrospirota bacterium]